MCDWEGGLCTTRGMNRVQKTLFICSMNTDSKKKLIYATAFALRLALFSFPSVANTLVQRVELSTPVTSYKRRKYKTHVPKGTF